MSRSQNAVIGISLFLAWAIFAAGDLQTAESTKASFRGERQKISDPRVQPFTDIAKREINPGREAASSLLADCDGEWQGVATVIVLDWFFGDEYYLTYQDPSETGCLNTYPFNVQTIDWEVFNSDSVNFSLNVQPVIFSVDLSDPECPKPGRLLFEGLIYEAELPPGFVGIGLPLPDFCVNEPYFAGVFTPDFIGFGIMDITTDSAGVGGGLFPKRTCASYNNYAGFWEDVITEGGFPGNVRLWSEGVSSDQNSCGGCVTLVEPGVDLWRTPAHGGSVESGFTSDPIPADFFGPGSDPFGGSINLVGQPLFADPSDALGMTDIIVERQDRAVLPNIGSSDVVEIEIQALNLVSIEPITVTYNGGQNPETWEVFVCLSDRASQSTGSMTITRECCDGGSYTSSLPILPAYTFIRKSDQRELLFDFSLMGLEPLQLTTAHGYWSATLPDPYDLEVSAGLVGIDQECDGVLDIGMLPSSNFIPGIRRLPCDQENSGPGVGRILTRQIAPLATLAALPPERTVPTEGEGACCLGDNSCLLTTPTICAGNSGTYQGNGTDCYPLPCHPLACCQGETVGNVDCGGLIDIGDVAVAIQKMFITLDDFCCEEEADIDGSGLIDIGDLSMLITALFITLEPLPPCPGR